MVQRFGFRVLYRVYNLGYWFRTQGLGLGLGLGFRI
jgi:hypothetical protein